MSYPTTITLNVGSPAADVVYTKDNNSGQGVSLWSAPSPQGDLEGRSALVIRNTENNKGLVRTNLKITKPVYDSDAGVYIGHIQMDCTITRTSIMPTDDVQDVVEQGEKALVQLKDEMALAES